MSDWSIKKKKLYKIKKSQNNNRDVEFMRYDEKKNLNENEKKIKVNSMRLKTQETKFK